MNIIARVLVTSIIITSCVGVKQSVADIIINSEIEDSNTGDGYKCRQQGSTNVGDCTQSFSADNETISIVTDGNILLRGTTDFEDTGAGGDYVGSGANTAIYAADDLELSNLKIVISANTDEGIVQDIASKGGPAVYIGKSNYLESFNMESGKIETQDTAFFIVDSGSNETQINISSGAVIKGARAAIRQDVDTLLPQGSDENDGVNDTPSGYLKMVVNNDGDIISDATLLSPNGNNTADTSNAGNAFRFGNNKVSRDVVVNNNGNIEGNIELGMLKFAEYSDTKNYVKSSFKLVNNATVNAAEFYADFNNDVIIINNESGTITMADRQYYYDDTAIPTASGYGTQNEQSIRLYSKNSQFTNYGTVNAGITTYSSNSQIDLLKGKYSGRLNYAGDLNLSDDLTEESLKGSITTLRDYYSNTHESILDIGGTVKYLKKNGGVNLVNTAYDGSLTIETGVYGGSNTISVSANTDSKTFGRLNMEGYAKVEADTTKLNINLTGETTTYTFLEEGVEYVIIDGNEDESGNDVNKIDDENISVNGITGNTYGLIQFITAANDADVDGKNSNLVLYVDRADAEDFTSDALVADVYDAIIGAGSSASGKMLEFQAYLDSLTNYGDIEAALKSAGPVNAGDIELATLTPIFNFLETTNRRIDYFFDHRNGVEATGSSKQTEYRVTNDEFLSCFSLDESNKKYKFNKELDLCASLFPEDEVIPRLTNEDVAIWTQGFGTYEKQKATQTNDGFRANIYGFSIGADKKINQNGLVGAAFSFANSDVNSLNKLKNTGITSYQFNVYGGQTYDNDYFWDVIVGYTLNRYKSSRLIPSIATTANSDYDGSNYFGQARVGKEFRNVKDTRINIIPELSTTFITTNVQDYLEKDAGTMNLYVNSNTDDYFEGRVGINAHKEDCVTINNVKIPITLKTHLSYGYNFKNQDQVTVSRFAAQSNIISHNSTKIGAESVRIGTGIDLHHNNSTVFSIDYLMDRRRNFISHSGMAKVRYQF